MTLKNAVNEIMDFAKAHDCDMHVAYAKISHMVKAGELDHITTDELTDAHEFLNKNYFLAVTARQTGNEADFDKALEEWSNGRGN